MAASNHNVTLSADQLNDWDVRILDYLANGRATPALVKEVALDRNDVETISRQYINSRMKRLAEHGHLDNLFDTGVYELRDDPRD